MEILVPRETILAGQYVYLESLTETNFARVIKCADIINNELVAIKTVRRSLSKLGEQEFNTINRLNRDKTNTGIVSAKGMFYFHRHVCIVMELLGPNLYEVVRSSRSPLSVKQLGNISVHLLRSVYLLHKQGEIHADLKPSNIAFNMNLTSIKLLDFGNAMDISDTPLYYDKFEVQTVPYRAPELVFGVPFGPEIDMWTIGLILMEMCVGSPLFTARSNDDLINEWSHFFKGVDNNPFIGGKFFSKHLKGVFQAGEEYSPRDESKGNIDYESQATRRRVHSILALKAPHFAHNNHLVDLLAGLLKFDPKKRFSALDAIQHEFFHELPIYAE